MFTRTRLGQNCAQSCEAVSSSLVISISSPNGPNSSAGWVSSSGTSCKHIVLEIDGMNTSYCKINRNGKRLSEHDAPFAEIRDKSQPLADVLHPSEFTLD